MAAMTLAEQAASARRRHVTSRSPWADVPASKARPSAASSKPARERSGWTFGPGDKVMQIENNYDKEVYNWDLGVVSRIDIRRRCELQVDFDGREVTYGVGELDELVLACATTMRKSQDSEYCAVVPPLGAKSRDANS
jgi:ATP-dependent exoDNAse (exonuclease V) alpha subunit